MLYQLICMSFSHSTPKFSNYDTGVLNEKIHYFLLEYK